MFNLVRQLRQYWRGARLDSGARGREELFSEPIRLIAITPSREDQDRLRQIAAACGWTIRIVESSGPALALLRERAVPLVICDRDIPGEDWRDILVRIAALPQSVCVLLASAVMDQYLWDEVTRHHGYDIVRKPFDSEELHRVVRFAWSWSSWTSDRHRKALR